MSSQFLFSTRDFCDKYQVYCAAIQKVKTWDNICMWVTSGSFFWDAGLTWNCGALKENPPDCDCYVGYVCNLSLLKTFSSGPCAT